MVYLYFWKLLIYLLFDLQLQAKVKEVLNGTLMLDEENGDSPKEAEKKPKY